jgi:hypothetical protein
MPTPEPTEYINGAAEVVVTVTDPTTNTIVGAGLMTFFVPNTPTCPTTPKTPPNEALKTNISCPSS